MRKQCSFRGNKGVREDLPELGRVAEVRRVGNVDIPGETEGFRAASVNFMGRSEIVEFQGLQPRCPISDPSPQGGVNQLPPGHLSPKDRAREEPGQARGPSEGARNWHSME